jgi:hypothetical protein
LLHFLQFQIMFLWTSWYIILCLSFWLFPYTVLQPPNTVISCIIDWIADCLFQLIFSKYIFHSMISTHFFDDWLPGVLPICGSRFFVFHSTSYPGSGLGCSQGQKKGRAYTPYWVMILGRVSPHVQDCSCEVSQFDSPVVVKMLMHRLFNLPLNISLKEQRWL